MTVYAKREKVKKKKKKKKLYIHLHVKFTLQLFQKNRLKFFNRGLEKKKGARGRRRYNTKHMNILHCIDTLFKGTQNIVNVNLKNTGSIISMYNSYLTH